MEYIKGVRKWRKKRNDIKLRGSRWTKWWGRRLRDGKLRDQCGRYGKDKLEENIRGSTGKCTWRKMKETGAGEWVKQTLLLMDERGRERQRGGNHVLSQWDNDVSTRDQAVKMGKCLSSSLKCPLPDPSRWKLKWWGLDGKTVSIYF